MRSSTRHPDLPGMPLTREQALLAAGVLALAFADEAAAPPGGTIAQGVAAQQAAANAGAAALKKGTGAPKKVATAPGSVKYHAPIGALIIPHGTAGGPLHYVHGQPGHMIHSTSEPEWIANQWKDKDHAKAEAEKAVAAGTHHWVQAGEHSYAVHNSLEVHVPKDTDLHDEAAVKNAPKVAVKYGDHPQHLVLNPAKPGEPMTHGDAAQDLLAKDYKKLPAEPAKKAVQVQGKHAAWVPSDWQVYKAAGKDEGQLAGKWAKDPQGTWHFIGTGGEEPSLAHGADEWVKSGELIPDSHPGPEPGHVVPNQAAEGPEKPKAEVGGVAVTKEELHQAIAKLQGSPSTQIKGLLKGHPLEKSDYHAVFKAELEAHPELKVPSGTKKQHSSPAKLAFIHHLAGQAEKLAADEAQAKAAKEAKAKAEAAAVHAQQLTPGTVDIGGVTASAEHIQDAMAHLTASKSTAIKQVLKAKGNPLAAADYWQVINDWKAAHPEGVPSAHGTKQAHAPNAKTMFLAALAGYAAKLGGQDAGTGHSAAAELDQVISGGQVKAGWGMSAEGAVARALKVSAEKGSTRFAYLGPEPGAWVAGSVFPPTGKAYYEVTPEHKVSLHLSSGEVHYWTDEKAAEVAKEWIKPAVGKPTDYEDFAAWKAAKDKAEPVPVWDTKAWKQTPEYQAVHDVVESPGSGEQPLANKLDTDQQLAMALYVSAKQGVVRYLVPGDHGGWEVTSKLPAGVAGTFGMPGKAYYEVSPDHEVTAYGSDGQPVALPGEQIKQIAEKWLVPPEPVQPELEPVVPEVSPVVPEVGPVVPGQQEAGIAQLRQLLVNGAVKPSTEFEGGKSNPDWVLVSVLQKAAKSGKEAWAAKKPHLPYWVIYVYDHGLTADAEWFHVSAGLAVVHHADGKDTPVSPDKVSVLVHQLVTPDAVKIDMAGKYELKPQVFKHGFYYKPSKGAKSYLEIKPPGEGSSSATFVYHAPSGDKQVNASYAAKVLQDATEYHAQPKGTPSVKKAAYATTAKPGVYQLWSDVSHAPSPDHTAELHGDGSVLLSYPGGSQPLPVNDHGSPADALLEGGSLLDQYGTSVVKPGVKTDAYHVFGGEAKTPEQLKDLLGQFELGYSSLNEISSLMMKELAPSGSSQMKLAYSFFGYKNANGTWQGQRDAVMGLLRELLKVPQQPGAGAAEVKFLKGLPPGIHDAKDVFAWTGQGYAKPAVLSYSPFASSTELSAEIKAVSAKFGDGKVVGTHVSSLARDQKLAWLKAWQDGDMQQVFALDAAGGKVSPVHPGAPGNEGTHHVTWAPWDPSQVPASKEIEGSWSSPGVAPSKAEVDNYLIKAGLQHAAFLSPADRRAWVKAHRSHDQQAVDKLSELAASRFASGSQPLSEPPAWSASFDPAKSYTIYVEDGTPADQWTHKARDDFAAAHKDLLAPFAAQLAQEVSLPYTPEELLAGYMKGKVIQKYLDDKAAKELAGKLRPKYELVPGEPGLATDQYGHKFIWHPGGGKSAKTRLAVYELAKAWGIKAPRVQQVKLEADGTPGTITDLLEHDGTLAGLTPAGAKLLTGKELGDIAREHVFDYALANPSSTPGDYVRSGGSVTGTGKAGAFSDLAWDGADLAHLDDVTQQPVSLLFSAVSGGWLSREQADIAYAAAVSAARRMSQISGARLAKILNAAGLPVTGQTDLFQRVTELPDRIQALWDGVYSGRGWIPPEVPVAKLPHGLHSGFSEPEFFDHVMAAKAAGVPAFFAGPDLEDAHFLVWTEKAGDNRYLRGESALRGAALDKAVAWAKQHVTSTGTSLQEAVQPAAVKNVSSWHAKVLAAAKAVSRHAADQLWDGPVTKQALQEMASLKTQLAGLVQEAETALESGDPAAFSSLHGHPYLTRHAAQYYLDKIAEVEDRKANALTFKPGDIAAWEAPPLPGQEHPEPPAGVKVEYLKATRVLAKAQLNAGTGSVDGDIHGPDGELQLGSGIYEYPGYAWHITLPTGELVELNDEAFTSSPFGHYGRVRFRAVASDGSASLERVRSHLQEMGVPLEEASPEDMELFYWRHLAYVLADRKDRADGKHAQVWSSLASAVPETAKVAGESGKVDKVIAANLDPAAELDAWHQAWSALTSPEQVQDWADKGGYLPHLPHLNMAGADVPSGKPYWYRFDADPEWLAGRKLVAHSLYGGTGAAYQVATSGGLYSTEGRLRSLGVWISGSSSSTDMKNHGSSGFVYTRLNQETAYGKEVLVSPRVLARTSTYGFSSDNCGDVKSRKTQAYFDLAKAASWTGGTNETEVKDAISLLDDIMLLQAGSKRDEILAALKARGVTQIRGLPAEDRIVSHITPEDIAKVKAAEPDPATWFGHPAEPWSPPHAEPVAGEQSVVQSQAENAVSHAAVADLQVSAEHSQGAAPEAVSQLFYHVPSKPSLGQLNAEKVKVKIAAGQRVADAMKSPTEDITALAAAAGIHVPAEWGPARQATVGAFIAVWAQTNSSVFAHALQQAAHALFGIGKPQAITLSPEMQAEVDQLMANYGAVIDDFLLAQYDSTQQDLKDAGITHLTLARAFNWSTGSGPWGQQLFGKGVPGWAQGLKAGDQVEVPPSKPFASWAAEFEKGASAYAEFTGYGPYTIVKATVPAGLVLSYPRAGMGSYWQSEFIVLDSAGQWEVVDAG